MAMSDEEGRVELTAEQARRLRGLIDDLAELATRVEGFAQGLDEEGQARAGLDCVDFDHLRPALSGLQGILTEAMEEMKNES